MSYRSVHIEKKHTYQNFSEQFIYDLKTQPCNYTFQPKYPTVQGYESDERIGDKISPISMVLDMTVCHTGYTLGAPFQYEQYTTPTYQTTGTFTNGSGTLLSTSVDQIHSKAPTDWFAQFRLFLLDVDVSSTIGDDADKSKTWFENNFVPYVYPSTDPVVDGQWNNQTDMLRETTADTGTFKILHDYKFTLTNRKPLKHIVKTFPMKGILNFEKNGTKLTNRKLVFILFGPLNYINESYVIHQELNLGVRCSVKGVLKLNYIDN